MFKVNELKAELLKRNISYKELAKIIGVCEKSIYDKMNELSDWKYSELLSIKALIGKKLFDYIFFE